MKKIEELAQYISLVTYEDLSIAAIKALKIRLLNSLGCAIGALKHPMIENIKLLIDDFGGSPLTTLVDGGKTMG